MPVERFPMTDEQRLKAELLSHCTQLPGSFEKRFCRDMHAASKQEDAALTVKQAAFLDKCYWRYRRQIGDYAEPNGKVIPPFVEPPKVAHPSQSPEVAALHEHLAEKMDKMLPFETKPKFEMDQMHLFED